MEIRLRPGLADLVKKDVERGSYASVRPDLTPLPVRFWAALPYHNYFIVYDPETEPLRVIRIIHAARDLPSILI
jgi:plasmid stabilization system protein ParE